MYIKIIRLDTTVLSETLTESLLKRSINEKSLLDDDSAGLYFGPTIGNTENQIMKLDFIGLKNSMDRLNNMLINTYRKQLEHFCESKESLIPLELQEDPVNKSLKILMEISSLIERAYQIDSMYPNLKQTIISYFTNKLKNLHNKDINPNAIRVLFFDKEEGNKDSIILDLDLISFVLNYSWYSHVLNTDTPLFSLKAQDVNLEEIGSDILSIQSQHQAKLDVFWQKKLY